MARRSKTQPWWASPWPPVAALLALASAFIARASFVTQDGRTFTLFDDAMVSMRYARNLAEGHGLVYNAGQAPVEGYTNFLWTLWMALLHLAPVPVRFVPLLVSLSGVALLVLGVVLVGRIARALAPDEPAVPAIAMWATALYYPLLFWTLRGLEPGLLSVLLGGSVLLAWRAREEPTPGRTAALAVLLAAGVLTRTDFVVVAGVVLLWLARPGAARAARRTALSAGIVVLVVLGAHMLFELLSYGSAVPNTYALKMEGVGLGTRLARGGAAFGILVLAELAVVLALALVGLRNLHRGRDRAWLLMVLFGAAAGYSVFVGGDAWEYLQYANRYLTPVVPLLIVLAALGCREVVSWPRARAATAIFGLALVATGATLGATALHEDGNGFNLRNGLNAGLLTRAHWIALAGGLALLLFCLLLLARRPALATGAIAGALIVLVTLPAWTAWAHDAGHLVRQNEQETRLGLELGSIAHGRPEVAVVAGGTIPYWSTLPAVDLLGKSDATVATGPDVRAGFLPGHTKWDYRYSICTLRPALVTQLFEATPADRHLIEGCGYDHIWDDYYVRRDQDAFDRQALARMVFETGP